MKTVNDPLDKRGDESQAPPRTMADYDDFLIHPGIVLKEEFMGEMSQVELARRTGLTTTTINLILQGKRRIMPDTARALGKCFKVPAALFYNLQAQYDLRKSEFAKAGASQALETSLDPSPELPEAPERLVIRAGKPTNKLRL